jgi:hypothetical protein
LRATTMWAILHPCSRREYGVSPLVKQV